MELFGLKLKPNQPALNIGYSGGSGKRSQAILHVRQASLTPEAGKGCCYVEVVYENMNAFVIGRLDRDNAFACQLDLTVNPDDV